MNIQRHPPPLQSTPDFHLCLSRSLASHSFIHPPDLLSFLSFSSASHPSSYPLLHHVILVLSDAISPPCSSCLNQASSAEATILLSFIYVPLALYPLSLLLHPSIRLYVGSLSPFHQRILVIYSIKCFCIPSVAAFLFSSPMSLCFSLLAFLCFSLSILFPFHSQMSDKARE